MAASLPTRQDAAIGPRYGSDTLRSRSGPMSRSLAMILAGGRGARLGPLTCHRAKPAVPFGGRYRIIDFVLSNLVNSDHRRVYVLTQYMASSLIHHLQRNWHVSGLDGFIEVVPA